MDAWTLYENIAPGPQDRRPWLWVPCTLSSSLSTVTTAIKSGNKFRGFNVAIVEQTVQAWPSRQKCCRPSVYGGHSHHD